MTGISRRAVLSGGFAGVFGVLATGWAAPGWAALALQIPLGPMRLSRTLVRNLSGGKKIEVRRAWRIAFESQGHGIAITGQQIDAQVVAPKKLEPIAAIERSRSTDNKFPIMIDQSGLIISAGEAELASDVDHAIEVAEQIAAKNGGSMAQRQQLRAALSQVQAAGTTLLDRLPRDLFFPRNNGFADKRSISLPDGSSGEFEVNYSVTTQPRSGLLDEAMRQVVTRIGDTEQVSSERWELRAI